MTRRIRETILWVGATLGVLCIGWTLAMFASGLTPLVFTSGSMSPAIGAGDLGFAKSVDAAEIEVGDVISVVNLKGTRITHRVVQVDAADEGVTITMKGDANNDRDAEPYAVPDSAQRVVFSVPKAGHVVNAVSSPVGMFLGGLLAATALFVAFGRRGGDDGPPSSAEPDGESAEPDEPEQDRNVARRASRVLTVAAGASALVVAATMSAFQPTLAAWTDTSTVATDSLAASGPPLMAATMNCQTSGILITSATLSWSNSANRNGYRHAYTVEVANNAAMTGSNTVVLQPNTDTNRTYEFSPSWAGDWFGGTIWYVRVRAAFVNGSGAVTWQSSSYRSWSLNRVVLSSAFSCRSSIA